MIEITLKQALLIYSLLLGVIALVLWIYTGIRIRRPQRFLAKQYLWRCTFCGYSYLDEHADRISQCPQCNSYNEAEEDQAKFAPPSKKEKSEEPVNDTATSRRNPSRGKRPNARRRGPRRR